MMKASHILVEDLNTAVTLKAKIDVGEDFSDLARRYSRCPSGWRQGGDLGEFDRGAMVKAFEEATLALDIGSISEPVQTQFGWHLIQRTG